MPSDVSIFVLIKADLIEKIVSIFLQISETILFAISSNIPDYFKKIHELSSKIHVLCGEIWQRSIVDSAFFLSTTDDESAGKNPGIWSRNLATAGPAKNANASAEC